MNNITYFSLTGVQVLRTVLNKFSVNNRKNMFVVKELVDSDLVYYLRYVELVRHTCTIENNRLMAKVFFCLFYLCNSLIISSCTYIILKYFYLFHMNNLQEFLRNVLNI